MSPHATAMVIGKVDSTYRKIKETFGERKTECINIKSSNGKPPLGRKDKGTILRCLNICIFSFSATDVLYQSTWFAFKRLQFLWDKDKPRGGLSTLSTFLLQSKHLINEELKFLKSTICFNYSTGCRMPAPDNEQEQADTQHAEGTIGTISCPPQPVSHKRKRRVEDERLEKAFEILAESASKHQEEDECQIFGNLVVKSMQKYSPINRAEIEHSLVDILLRADRGQYDHFPHPLPSPVHSTYSQYPHHAAQNNVHQLPNPSHFQGYTSPCGWGWQNNTTVTPACRKRRLKGASGALNFGAWVGDQGALRGVLALLPLTCARLLTFIYPIQLPLVNSCSFPTPTVLRMEA
ncbi:uncharacterized protein [Anabrus simplex]|uniref:uncharacterized protein n=1 Tax=Anabrus simplex TaxID=316456 RepID=UPI0035A2A560